MTATATTSTRTPQAPPHEPIWELAAACGADPDALDAHEVISGDLFIELVRTLPAARSTR